MVIISLKRWTSWKIDNCCPWECEFLSLMTWHDFPDFKNSRSLSFLKRNGGSNRHQIEEFPALMRFNDNDFFDVLPVCFRTHCHLHFIRFIKWLKTLLLNGVLEQNLFICPSPIHEISNKILQENTNAHQIGSATYQMPKDLRGQTTISGLLRKHCLGTPFHRRIPLAV